MEAHPVPKNVLDVEFKLFGSLSVKQAGKVLVGSLIGLSLYVLTVQVGLPALITFPLIIVSVLGGIASALVPAFETKSSALIKSIFISPRYVWKKKTKVPDILSNQGKTAAKQAVGVSNTGESNTAKKQPHSAIDDLSIDEILTARSSYAKQAGIDEDDVTGSSYFTKVYEQQFANDVTSISDIIPKPAAKVVDKNSQNLASSRADGDKSQVLHMGENMATVINPLQNRDQRPALDINAAAQAAKIQQQADAANNNRGTDLAAYKNEIQALRQKLNELNRQTGTEELRHQVLTRLNELYNLIGIAPKQEIVTDTHKNKMVFGVVVDKSGKPIPGAEVKLLDEHDNEVGTKTTTLEDGKFAIAISDKVPEVHINISKENHRFHTFKVDVSSSKLPAFKFREH